MKIIWNIFVAFMLFWAMSLVFSYFGDLYNKFGGQNHKENQGNQIQNEQTIWMADPEQTISFLWALRKYSKELNVDKEKILTTQCNEYARLYKEQSVTTEMKDGTKVTMLIPENTPRKDDTKDTFTPDYDDEIENFAWNCIASLIKNKVIDLDDNQIKEMIASLHFKKR